MALNLTAALEGILLDNGLVDVGLGVGTDHRNPDNRCIPVPRNILEGSTDASRFRVAKWAYDKILDNAGAAGAVTAGDEVVAQAAWVVWMLGWVGTRRMPRNQNVRTVDGLVPLEWEGDVLIYDEDVVDINGDITDNNRRDFIPVAKERFTQLTTILLAGKITWWATKHHLGPRMVVAAGGRSRYGYLEKAVQAYAIPNFDLTSEAGTARVHDACHQASTTAVMRVLATTATGATDISSTIRKLYPMPGVYTAAVQKTQSTSASREKWEPVTRTPIRLGDDVKIRARAFGAGARAVEDGVTALRLVSGSPLYPHLPGRGQLKALIDLYTAIKADPFSYGQSAGYLAVAPQEISYEPVAEILANLKAYVTTVHRESSLARARAISDDANAGVGASWKSMCNVYAARAQVGSEMIEKVVEALQSHFGAATGSKVNDAEVNLLKAINAPTAKDAWNHGIDEAEALLDTSE